jgi:hypothetical protein
MEDCRIINNYIDINGYHQEVLADPYCLCEDGTETVIFDEDNEELFCVDCGQRKKVKLNDPILSEDQVKSYWLLK